MSVGQRRNFTRSVTVAANTTRGFKQAVPGAIVLAHAFSEFSSDDPGLELMSFTINGVHSKRVNPGDSACFVLANNTSASITTNITVTIEELPASTPPG